MANVFSPEIKPPQFEISRDLIARKYHTLWDGFTLAIPVFGRPPRVYLPVQDRWVTMTPSGGGGGFIVPRHRHGMAFEVDTRTDGWEVTDLGVQLSELINLDTEGPCTLMCLGRNTATTDMLFSIGSASDNVISLGTDNTSGGPVLLFRNGSANQHDIQGDSADQWQAGGSPTIVAGVTLLGATAGDVWFRGRLSASYTSAASVTFADGTAQVSIGGRVAGFGFACQPGSRLHIGYAWNRELTAREHMLVKMDPFWVRPERDRAYRTSVVVGEPVAAWSHRENTLLRI